MKIALTFGSELYEDYLKAWEDSAKLYFDRIICTRPRDIAEFMSQRPELFAHPRGYGFMCWKPYIILRTLLGLNDGDYVFYTDARCKFVADPSPLYPYCDERDGVLLFYHGHHNRKFTRRETFRLMACDSPEYIDGRQLCTTYHVWKRTRFAMAIAEAWMGWATRPEIVADPPSRDGQDPEFEGHRHDQSVLALLQIRHNIQMCRDPSNWYQPIDDLPGEYPQILQSKIF